MEFINIAAFSVVAILLISLVKNYKSEYAIILSILVGVGIFIFVLSEVEPVLSFINDLFISAGTKAQYVNILFKSIGISFVASLASDICLDAGEKAVATKVELAARVAILIVALPLFERTIEVLKTLIV